MKRRKLKMWVKVVLVIILIGGLIILYNNIKQKKTKNIIKLLKQYNYNLIIIINITYKANNNYNNKKDRVARAQPAATKPYYSGVSTNNWA